MSEDQEIARSFRILDIDRIAQGEGDWLGANTVGLKTDSPIVTMIAGSRPSTRVFAHDKERLPC